MKADGFGFTWMPSPRSANDSSGSLDVCPEVLFDRFGSLEALTAAVDDFYHRVAADEHVGQAIKQVPEAGVRSTLLQLMELSLAEGTPEALGAGYGAGQDQDHRQWLVHCKRLLGPALADEASAAKAYQAVAGHLAATLAALGAVPGDSMP